MNEIQTTYIKNISFFFHNKATTRTEPWLARSRLSRSRRFLCAGLTAGLVWSRIMELRGSLITSSLLDHGEISFAVSIVFPLREACVGRFLLGEF